MSSWGDALQLGGRLEIVAASRLAWRLRAGVEAVAIFASLTSRRLLEKMTSRRFARAALSTSLRSGYADWVVLGHGTNVTRVTRGENIFNNKIYIGDLASINDVKCPAARYRGEYQEVPATLITKTFSPYTNFVDLFS